MSQVALPAGADHKPALLGRFSPFKLAIGCLVLAMSALIVYPIAIVVIRAFTVDGHLSAQGIAAALAQPGIGGVVVNTITLVACSGLAALVIGAAFAWLNERTDARLGWVTDLLPLIPLLMPQIAGAIGWVVLLSPQAGLVNGWLRDLLKAIGIERRSGPLDIYSFPGLIFVMALYLVPYVYLIVSASLRNLDPHLEEASRISGAGPLRTLRRVTLPAIRPALTAAALILVIIGFAQFSAPIIIGTGARIEVLSVRIYRLLYNYPPRTDFAVALSLIMLVIVFAALFLQNLVTRKGRHARIGGKGAQAPRLPLGRWRGPARIAMTLYMLATAVLPSIGLLIVSGQAFWSPAIVWEKLSLMNYESVLFANKMTRHALTNSLLLGAVGATIGMLIAAVIALFVQRTGQSTRRLIDAVVTLPAAVPHTVVAVGFLLAFSQGLFNLHGTLMVLLLIYLVMYLPQGERAASAAMAQVGTELLEASQVFGASPGRTFRRVLLPLMLPGLVAGWIMLFVLMAGELTASALLAGGNNPVVGLVLLDIWENGSFPQLAALAVIITAIDSVVVMLVMRTMHRSFALRVG